MVKKIASAVDISLETIHRAISEKCDLILVHHGLYWGKPLVVTGRAYAMIKLMLENDIALIAQHLPLDLHPEIGNNALIAKELGLRKVERLEDPKVHGLVFTGEFPKSFSLSDFLSFFEKKIGSLSLWSMAEKKFCKKSASSAVAVALRWKRPSRRDAIYLSRATPTTPFSRR